MKSGEETHTGGIERIQPGYIENKASPGVGRRGRQNAFHGVQPRYVQNPPDRQSHNTRRHRHYRSIGGSGVRGGIPESGLGFLRPGEKV